MRTKPAHDSPREYRVTESQRWRRTGDETTTDRTSALDNSLAPRPLTFRTESQRGDIRYRVLRVGQKATQTSADPGEQAPPCSVWHILRNQMPFKRQCQIFLKTSLKTQAVANHASTVKKVIVLLSVKRSQKLKYPCKKAEEQIFSSTWIEAPGLEWGYQSMRRPKSFVNLNPTKSNKFYSLIASRTRGTRYKNWCYKPKSGISARFFTARGRYVVLPLKRNVHPSRKNFELFKRVADKALLKRRRSLFLLFRSGICCLMLDVWCNITRLIWIVVTNSWINT